MWLVTRTKGSGTFKQFDCPKKHLFSRVLCEMSEKNVKDWNWQKKKITWSLICCYLLLILPFTVFELFYNSINCWKLITMLIMPYLHKCKLIVSWGKVIDCCPVARPFLHLFVNSFQHSLLLIYVWFFKFTFEPMVTSYWCPH